MLRLALYPDDACLVDHLVADRDIPRPLYDLIRVAVHARNHRARESPRDAPFPEAEILGTIERPVAEARARPRCSRRARASLGCHRRNFSVGRIDHEPRPAAPGDFVDVAKFRGVADLPFGIPAEELGAVEGIGLTLHDGVLQLLRRDVFEPPAAE